MRGCFGYNVWHDGEHTHLHTLRKRSPHTQRQRLGRFVRKSLACSKKAEFHRIALALFIHEYNLEHAS